MFKLSKLCFICLAIAAVFWPGHLPATAGAKQSDRTRVAPHLNVPIVAGQNVVFCSTFQIAWNDMRNRIVQEPIRLAGSRELVMHLNHGRPNRSDLDDGDYLAMAGYGKDKIADRINRALSRKFGSTAPTVSQVYNDDDAILAYAFLFKDLRFDIPFEVYSQPMSFYGDQEEIKATVFGIHHYNEARHRQLRDQVEIIDYANPRDFIVRLATTNPGDELILARIKPEQTLFQTWEKVNRRIWDSQEQSRIMFLEDQDVVQIPKLKLSIDHTYQSLLGLHLLNEGFEDYFVAEAGQGIRFKLDEFGASAMSEAVFLLKKGWVGHKLLIFNRAFLVYLKKKSGDLPYFAMWVENADVMVAEN